MPNHVTTRCWTTGPAEEIARFRATMLTTNPGFEQRWNDTEKKHEDDPAKPTTITSFDFNAVIPMPEIIKGSESSSVVWNGLLVLGRTDLDRHHTSPEAMLTWPWVVEAGVTDIEGLKKLLVQRSPDCVAKAEQAIKAYEECGHTDWYGWSLENWGTKWNAYSERIVSESSEAIEFLFDTAWSFPEPVFTAIAEKYPALRIRTASFDEGYCFACKGEWHGPGSDGIHDVPTSDSNYELVYGEPPKHEEDDEHPVAVSEDDGEVN